MPRFCASCGTEVDDTAVFCPTCGQPIDVEADSDIPPAPAWPDREPEAAHAPVPPPAADEPTRVEPGPPDRASSTYAPGSGEAASGHARPGTADAPPAPEGRTGTPLAPPAVTPRSSDARAGTGSRVASRGRGTNLPLTTPVTISAWLIGVGAIVAAIGALISLFDGLGTAVDLLILLALLGVAATVFLSTNLPAIPHLMLATLVVVLVTLGVALDRLALGRAGAGELLLFLGAAAAAIGAVLVETGNDQPMGGTSR